MTRVSILLAKTTFPVLIVCLPASGQTEQQSWPEISTYVQLNSSTRFHFLASKTRENRASTEAEIGPDLDFYLKPLFKLKRFGGFQLDQSKSRLLNFRVGYHYLPQSQGPTENRVILEATTRYPLQAGFLVSDRNRADLRFINGQYSWRYRNRLMVERTFAIRSYRFSPYVREEAYFDSKYEKWSRFAVASGIAFPIRKHSEIEVGYEHQNDTGGRPNRRVNALVLALNLYFSP